LIDEVGELARTRAELHPSPARPNGFRDPAPRSLRQGDEAIYDALPDTFRNWFETIAYLLGEPATQRVQYR
jgi:hypothetical protein